MKLTESRIKQIILEEIQAIAEAEEKQKFAAGPGISSSARASQLKKAAGQASSAEKGIDSKEYSILQQVEELLKDIANTSDLKTGSAATILKSMYTKLDAIRDQLNKKQAK